MEKHTLLPPLEIQFICCCVVVMFGNIKRLYRIYIFFSYLLWCWNVCSPHALVNEFVHFLLLCYQWSDVTIIWCTLLSALVWLCLTLVNGIKDSSASDLVQDMSLGVYYLHFFCRCSTWYFILHILPDTSLDSNLNRQNELGMLWPSWAHTG